MGRGSPRPRAGPWPPLPARPCEPTARPPLRGSLRSEPPLHPCVEPLPPAVHGRREHQPQEPGPQAGSRRGEGQSAISALSTQSEGGSSRMMARSAAALSSLESDSLKAMTITWGPTSRMARTRPMSWRSWSSAEPKSTTSRWRRRHERLRLLAALDQAEAAGAAPQRRLTGGSGWGLQDLLRTAVARDGVAARMVTGLTGNRPWRLGSTLRERPDRPGRQSAPPGCRALARHDRQSSIASRG